MDEEWRRPLDVQQASLAMETVQGMGQVAFGPPRG